MNKNEKSIRIFSALILTAFAAAVLYFAGSIVFALKQGPERAERDFIKLSDQINSDAASLNRYQASEHKYIAAFIIYSQQNTLFAYPASSNLIQTDTAGTPVLRNSSPFIKIFNTSLSVSQMPNTVLSAAIYTLHPSDIYNPARISFLAVLVCTLAVFTVLVYYAASAKTNASDTENTSEKIISDYAMQSEDIDFFIPHQANIRIIDAVKNRLNFRDEQCVLTVAKYGNTSSASIPMAINDAYEDGRIKNGSVLLLDAFGGGFTWGSAILKFGGKNFSDM